MSLHSAVDLFGIDARDANAAAAQMAQQFVEQNRALFSTMDVDVRPQYDGRSVLLQVQAGSAVGAIPLLSPTSARPDFGLVIKPRFAWAGIGIMLAEMGWRVSPTPLKLPLLRRSERRVPVWVLAHMILSRLKALLRSLDRRFEMSEATLPAPRGQVQWSEYARRSLVRGRFEDVPCRFPELTDDRLLKGAVRFAIERQLRALDTQRHHGAFVHRLIELAQSLLETVRHVPAIAPSNTTLNRWAQRPLKAESLIAGIQAIEWTAEERGLAGLSDLEGLPWTLPMNSFYEAWVETVCDTAALRLGAQVRVGRKKETVHAIRWEPPYLGSQRSLVPDVWLQWSDLTLILDAKYKRHWEELQQTSWAGVAEKLRQEHRNDILQVLAYANLAATSRVITCLAYPCSPESWRSLRERRRLFHRAEVGAAGRRVDVWLTAIPMGVNREDVAAELENVLRDAVSEAA